MWSRYEDEFVYVSSFIGRYRISYCHSIILMTHAGDEYVKSQLSVFCHMYCLFVFILSHQHQHHYHHHCHQYYRRHHNRHQHWDSFTIIALISSTAIIRICVIIFIVITPHKCSLMKHNLSANVPQYKLQATTELKLVTVKTLSHIKLYTSCIHVCEYKYIVLMNEIFAKKLPMKHFQNTVVNKICYRYISIHLYCYEV